MRYETTILSGLLVLIQLAGLAAGGQGGGMSANPAQDNDLTARRWLRQDLHLTAGTVLTHKVAPGQQLLLCQEDVSLAVGGRRLTASRGLVWVSPGAAQADGRAGGGYRVQVYLAGRVAGHNTDQGQDSAFAEIVLERGKAVVVQTTIGGEIFVTGVKSDTVNPRRLPLYEEGMAAFARAGLELPPAPLTQPPVVKGGTGEPNRPNAGYTINIAPLTDVPVKLEWGPAEGGGQIGTAIGRAYISWRQPAEARTEPGQLFELEADNLVAWSNTTGKEPAEANLSAAQLQGISDIYVSGNVMFREGQRTIYADSLYYDLGRRRALARNVVLKTFDTVRNVPIYIRATELRQLSADEFEGQDVVLTTSEFRTPQISLEAARIHVTDKPAQTEPQGAVPSSSTEVELNDVRFKYGGVTIFALPTVRGSTGQPELPLRSVNVGYDGTFGATFGTRWYLSRLLGLREPAGTDSTLALDYYSKRGPGGGVDINYAREDYFGSILGYVIDDHGEDRLSRTRQGVEVPEDLRGRFRLQHRQYLPYGWQLTGEVSYLSDENFLEQFYRTEYNVGKEQETLLYLKRIQDNWGLAFLGKVRINDFMDQVEELPSAEYHLAGQSLFDDLFTFFSDTQVSEYRYRFSPDNPVRTPNDFFLFTGTRNELDLPLKLGQMKIVPFVAGTFGYDGGAGFHAGLNDEPATPEDAIWIGEGGVRMATQPYWAIYPQVQSQLWDLNQLRHIIQPTLTAVAYTASDAVAEQRDIVDLQVAQRWQTKRGPANSLRTVNWLELNTDLVWVGDSNPQTAGPDRLIWSAPYIPLVDRSARTIPPLDRRATDLFGPRQNYAGADAILRLTDATSILGDGYFGMQTGTVEQTDIGFSRLVWPDLSYYMGLRYLRRFYFDGQERSSNAVTLAMTYVLDPRYTLVVSDQYDYGLGVNIATNLTLIRKYHRMNLGLTFGVDESLDETFVLFSLWPEGIPELAIGPRGYLGLGASDLYQ